MGGESRVFFTAIDAYARRMGIEGEDFETFRILFSAMDSEWLTWLALKQKEEAAKRDAGKKK